MDKEKGQVNWACLNHELPPETEKYLLMIIEATQADNHLKVLTRLQKVVRLMHDEILRKHGIEV